MPKLDFTGKQHIYAHHLTVPYRPLVPDPDKSLNPTGIDDNLIIHGDNLNALKALLPRYAGRVKCIYIDPPYNTGNEGWVYNDKVNSPLLKEWFKTQSPVDGEDLERHDKWLCMMWPRLQLLKELLADDGVIFISIDDNEQHHLRMLMNEIFGEENCVESFIWRSRQGRGATSRNTAKLHEYVLCYAKSADEVAFKGEKRIRESETRERLRQWGQGDRREDRPTMFYPVSSEEFGEVYPKRPDGSDGRWRVGKTKMEKLLKAGSVAFDLQPDGRIEAYRIFPEGTETEIAYPSMFDPEVVKTTAHGTRELRDILGADKFPYPKPSDLIKEIISLCTEDGDLVLDSFAGSGTTAHAVLALNEEAGGDRKFILVECEEKYADTVTAERVRRVINGIPDARGEALREGFPNSFIYCTLGDRIDPERMLTGEALPDYSSLAAYLLYTSSGDSAGPAELTPQNADGLFYSTADTDYYLLYRPDLAFLESNDAMLNEEKAERISAAANREGAGGKRRKAVVYGSGKYLSAELLRELGITFCQLPYEIYRLGQ